MRKKRRIQTCIHIQRRNVRRRFNSSRIRNRKIYRIRRRKVVRVRLTKAQHELDKANFEAVKAESKANFEENRFHNSLARAKEQSKNLGKMQK